MCVYQVRLSEVEWDEKKDEREGDAEREYLQVKADKGHGKEATDAQVCGIILIFFLFISFHIFFLRKLRMRRWQWLCASSMV